MWEYNIWKFRLQGVCAQKKLRIWIIRRSIQEQTTSKEYSQVHGLGVWGIWIFGYCVDITIHLSRGRWKTIFLSFGWFLHLAYRVQWFRKDVYVVSNVQTPRRLLERIYNSIFMYFFVYFNPWRIMTDKFFCFA